MTSAEVVQKHAALLFEAEALLRIPDDYRAAQKARDLLVLAGETRSAHLDAFPRPMLDWQETTDSRAQRNMEAGMLEAERQAWDTTRDQRFAAQAKAERVEAEARADARLKIEVEAIDRLTQQVKTVGVRR